MMQPSFRFVEVRQRRGNTAKQMESWKHEEIDPTIWTMAGVPGGFRKWFKRGNASLPFPVESRSV
tara:strand:- start:313 stop:507 length:195 start_codon:yes stop_codon:yes gene_type:complete